MSEKEEEYNSYFNIKKGEVGHSLNSGGFDEFMNEIDKQNISNMDSFVQKDPLLFSNDNSNENNNNQQLHEDKLFSFRKSQKNDSPEFENNGNTNSPFHQSNENSKEKKNEMVIDYSIINKNKVKINDSMKSLKNKNSNLDMFIIKDTSRNSIIKEGERNSLLDKKKKNDLYLFELDNKFERNNSNITNNNNNNNNKEVNRYKDNNNIRNNYASLQNKEKTNKVIKGLSVVSDDNNNKTLSNEYTLENGKLNDKNIKISSYVTMMKNRTVSNKKKENSSLEKIKNKITPVNLIKKEYKSFLALNHQATPLVKKKNKSELIQKEIKISPYKKKDSPIKKRKIKFKDDVINNIPKTNNNNNIGVINLLNDIKVQYQNEEQRYIEKEKDLISEIQILREKINHFSVNETNYQIEIEKLKRKTNNNTQSNQNIDELPSMTINSKLTDNSITKIDDFPKDLNNLLLKSNSIDSKINCSPISSSTNLIDKNNNNNNCGINIAKYKSFNKLFKMFKLNKALFYDKIEEDDFIDDLNEIDYDIIFNKYPQLKCFMQLMAKRFHKECESRLVLEEKTLKILTNDIKTIDYLEKKLKKYENKVVQRRKLKLNLNSSITNVNVSQNSIKSSDLYL